MPIVPLNLTNFSFKREHEDWIGPLEVSIPNQNSCVILTGINAGGKSLTLKSLEKFTKLLADPSNSNKKEFEVFAKASGIDEISARYEFFIPHESELFQIDVDNRDTLIRNVGSFERIEDYDLDNEDFFWALFHSIETRLCFKDDVFTYTRRLSLRLVVEFDFDYDSEGPEPPQEWGVNEECFSEWENVFENLSELPMDRMYNYGHWGVEEKILEKTGFKINSEFGFDTHNWWDKKEAIHFVTKKVIMLQVDEAYQVSTLTLEKLRPFNENANAKSDGKKWIDERLKDAYDKCRQYHISNDKKRGLETFASFLYPKRIKYIRNRDISRFEFSSAKGDEMLDWVSNPPVPTTEISIPKSERFRTQDFEESYPKNIEGICLRLIQHCPNLILEYDPDMFFWMIVSDFIDFPEELSSTYYSSGQRRVISIIEEIMNSDSGDVLLIDEPELSLHIDWQRRFIDQASALGKKLVIATHSPDIIYNHTEKVVEVPPSKEV